MVKFSVIEERGKVIARLTDCENDVYHILRKRLPWYVHIDPYAVQIRSVFKGVAKCHPDDTFDVEKGKALAKERAIAKYDRYVAGMLNAVVVDLDKYIQHIDARIDHYDHP